MLLLAVLTTYLKRLNVIKKNNTKIVHCIAEIVERPIQRARRRYGHYVVGLEDER